MKYCLLLLLILQAQFLFSQSGLSDSSGSCIARWKKGEEKTLLITHFKSSEGGEKRSSPFRFQYEARVTVLDSAETGYTVQWVFHLLADFKKAHPGLGDSMPVYEGLKMIFHTTPQGAFRDLANWQEVRDAYVKMFMISLPQPLNDTAKMILNKSLAMFADRGSVEAAFIKEIQLFHLPYGYSGTTHIAEVPTQLPLPGTKFTLPAVQTWQITSIDQQEHSFTLHVRQDVDSSNTRAFIEHLLKNISPGEDRTQQIMKEIPPGFRVLDDSQFRIQASTGWITHVSSTRSMNVAGMHNEDGFVIVLQQ